MPSGSCALSISWVGVVCQVPEELIFLLYIAVQRYTITVLCYCATTYFYTSSSTDTPCLYLSFWALPRSAAKNQTSLINLPYFPYSLSFLPLLSLYCDTITQAGFQFLAQSS